jgi:hypothetical protein
MAKPWSAKKKVSFGIPNFGTKVWSAKSFLLLVIQSLAAS